MCKGDTIKRYFSTHLWILKNYKQLTCSHGNSCHPWWWCQWFSSSILLTKKCKKAWKGERYNNVYLLNVWSSKMEFKKKLDSCYLKCFMQQCYFWKLFSLIPDYNMLHSASLPTFCDVHMSSLPCMYFHTLIHKSLSRYQYVSINMYAQSTCKR